MYQFFEPVVRPLLEAAEASVVIEVGSDEGYGTELLATWADEHGAALHVIDPKPKFDVGEWTGRWPGVIEFHVDLSLNVLGQLPPADVALIDGDHNWYTVFHELHALDRVTAEHDRPFPLTLLHDVGWPYGRRDLYYDPDTIPLEYRHPHRKGGLVAGQTALTNHGLNDTVHNAIEEGTPRNGVLTAVEDFVSLHGDRLELHVLPGMHGLAIIVDSAARQQVKTAVAEVLGADGLLRILTMVEDHWAGRMSRDAKMLKTRRKRLRRLEEELDDANAKLRTLRRRVREAERRYARLRSRRSVQAGLKVASFASPLERLRQVGLTGGRRKPATTARASDDSAASVPPGAAGTTSAEEPSPLVSGGSAATTSEEAPSADGSVQEGGPDDETACEVPGDAERKRKLEIVDPIESWTNRQQFIVQILERHGIGGLRVPQGPLRWAVGVDAVNRSKLLSAIAASRAPLALKSPKQKADLVPAAQADRTDELAEARVLDVVLPAEVQSGSPGYRCSIEFWESQPNGYLQSPNRNSVALDMAPADWFAPVDGGRLRTPEGPPPWDEIDFPIDVVFLWVDGNDPDWIARRDRHLQSSSDEPHFTAVHEGRFDSRDELRYSLRSVHYYAPWVHRIFLVTDRQRPAWLREDSDRITVIDHRDIFPSDAIPNFNSHSITARLHHIEELSEHYIMMNDDVFLGHPVGPRRFFHPGGQAKFFFTNQHRGVFEENTPWEGAGRRVQDLVRAELGVAGTRMLHHTPHPQLKSLQADLEQQFAKEYQATVHSRFRHQDDIEPVLLHAYFGHARGRTLPGTITNKTVSTGSRRFVNVLHELRESPKECAAFCLNDAPVTDEVPRAEVHRLLTAFLEDRFPHPAPWELG